MRGTDKYIDPDRNALWAGGRRCDQGGAHGTLSSGNPLTWAAQKVHGFLLHYTLCLIYKLNIFFRCVICHNKNNIKNPSASSKWGYIPALWRRKRIKKNSYCISSTVHRVILIKSFLTLPNRLMTEIHIAIAPHWWSPVSRWSRQIISPNPVLSLFIADVAVVDMSDVSRQPSLFYHLGVRESFDMANNVILYHDTDADTALSLKVQCIHLLLSTLFWESRIICLAEMPQ